LLERSQYALETVFISLLACYTVTRASVPAKHPLTAQLNPTPEPINLTPAATSMDMHQSPATVSTGSSGCTSLYPSTPVRHEQFDHTILAAKRSQRGHTISEDGSP
jgi:hypothetical protein